jgi:mono/diheme cytochrome c family protein
LKKHICVHLRSSAVAFLALLLGASITPALAQGDAKRGEYLAKAGGCLGCHTEAKDKATPYANIPPDPKAGIGKWSEEDFIRAMRHGRRPDGANYFPSFPYPSFTKIRDSDLRDLWAYLRSLPPSSQASRPHELGFFYRWRFLVTIWKWFFFTPGPFANIAGATEAINRGAYLVQALGHCGECHTPRNFLGGPKSARFLAGGKVEDKDVPNLTPTGLKKWNDRDLQQFLVAGMTPDGDFPSDAMAEVINNTTSKLTPEDVAATVAYLRSLPPLPD